MRTCFKTGVGLLLLTVFGVAGTQSDERVGNLIFKLPKGWTMEIRGSVASLKPSDAAAGAACSVTITAGLRSEGDLPKWLDKQFQPHIGVRQVVSKLPIPQQDDPSGWDACGLTVILQATPSAPRIFHMMIGFRRGSEAGTMHFVADREEYLQKYRQAAIAITDSIKPVGGFGNASPPALPGALQEQLGSFTFRIPQGWKAGRSSRLLSVTSEATELKGARIEVYQDEPIQGSIDAMFASKWESFRAGRTLVEASELQKSSKAGMTMMERGAIYGPDKIEHLFGLEVDRKFLLIRAVLVSTNQATAVQETIIRLLDAVAQGNPVKSEPPTPPRVSTSAPTPPGTGLTKVSNSGWVILQSDDFDPRQMSAPTNSAAPVEKAEEAAKNLAHQYLTDPAKGYDALVLAVRSSGFSIWDGNRKPLMQPLTKVRAGIAFSEDDLKLYYTMSRGGVRIRFGDFSDAFQRSLSLINPQWIWTASLMEAMKVGFASQDPGKHFFALFLAEVFKQSSGFSMMRTEMWDRAHVDPAVMLLIFHPFAECVRVQLNAIGSEVQKLAKAGPPKFESLESLLSPLYASTEPAGQLPGWAEDLDAGILTTLNGLLADAALDFYIKNMTGRAHELRSAHKLTRAQYLEIVKDLQNSKKFTEFMGNIGPFVNFVASITKFVTTYAALEAKFEISDPGEPLVRTKTRTAGEQRQVKVTLSINPSKVQQVMKDVRLYFAVLGIDLDQPAAGPLTDAQVNWTLLGEQDDVPVWFKGNNIRRSSTDSNGSAVVEIEGRPQKLDLSKLKLRPFIRRQPVGVSIAVKKPEIKQDMVDAFFGGLAIVTAGVGPVEGGTLGTLPGAKRGASGGGLVLGPVMEMLYRVDWAYKGFKLNVRDWRGEALYLDLNMTAKGSGSILMSGTAKKVSVFHSVHFLDGQGGDSILLFPTGEMMSAAEQAQLLKGKSATTNIYRSEYPVRLGVDIKDRLDWKGKKWIGGCLDGRSVPVDDWETWSAPARLDGSQPPQQTIIFKLAQNDDGKKGWIQTRAFNAGVYKDYSRSKPEYTTEAFYQGPAIKEWMQQMPIDVSTSEDRMMQGEAGEPDFLIQTSSGTETMPDRWFGTVAVTGTANWTVTRIIATSKEIAEVSSRMSLSRLMVRGAFSETRAMMAQLEARRYGPVVDEVLDPESTDLTSCFEVEAPVQGQLKHKKPPARGR